MGMRVNLNRVLKFDLESNQLIKVFEVSLSIVTNLGTEIGNSGSLYIKNLSELNEAREVLINRLFKELTNE